ncbi:hypothetical protein Dsin_029676 [Dipteronia sinensis]|uniref:NAB domain-containing protein n=1 Tax=Dipteronia sinensis TaxID=43782 RepID=A0AAD9ZTI5_9ROSI|nr:hypothetical protein Dsin_029676 [Dipteronia sinensis]
MASLLNQESRRKYSWWWDSHISPKNSKWLQENLTDMDAKVKAMIKLIEEDADSFARRAEMYYKKRPELMKLVEEFYRAYRALAERYDHATVELRQAHRTMAEAFPNQYAMHDDQPTGSSGPGAEPQTPEMPHPVRALIDPDDLQKDALGLSSTNLHALKKNGGYSEDSDSGISKKGLKQLNEIFGSGERKNGLKVHEAEESKQSLQDRFSHFSTENQNLKTQIPSESEHRGKAESEVEALKKTLAEIQAEKEAVLLQYQQSFQKFSSLENELKHLQKDAGGLDDRASKADIEIKVLNETLVKLEAERDAGLLQYNNCLERIATLETMISQSQEDARGLNERASKAEIEAQSLKQELSRLEAEKEAGLLQYRQCLEMIFALENKISLAEESSKMLNEQTERAETEVQTLKQALARLNEEKEAAAFQYEQCMDKIAKLESEIFRSQEDAKRLSSEVLLGVAKLKTAEQQCVLLESSNQFLQVEADNLAQKIAMKDQELSEKQTELEKVQTLMRDEHSRFVQIEAALQNLQKLHSQSQEEQQALTLELQNKLQTLKDLEICNHGLEEDNRQVRKENQNLHELNHSSTISIKNLQIEIINLKEMKEKLEKEIALQVEKSTSLQQEVLHLKEEMMELNTRYQALVEQVLSVGLKPESLESSVKVLQDENLKLKEVCRKHTDEREVLCEKLKDMDNLSERNVILQSSLSELNGKLGGSSERVKELQESCQFLREDKSSLVTEKATLLSQLQIMTENMQKLLEKNVSLEKSLSGANVELEGLKAKSKSLQEFCQLLKNEKSNLQNERGTLVSKLEIIERRLGNLENRFTKLEEKYVDLEKKKESTLCQVEELRGSLSAEQQERASYEHSSESRMADLENHVHLLQEESKLRKKEFEEELDKAVNSQVEIFILQKFLKDLEEKNLSLTIECQKHVETSKLSNKLISELETENLEQQVETEFLLDEIEKLRVGIYQVFRAVQLDPVNWHEDKMEQRQIPIPHILYNVEDLKSSLLRNEDEKQQLIVENSVLLTLLGQLRLEGAEFESEKKIVEQEFRILTEQQAMLQKDKRELVEMNSQLMLEVSDGEQRQVALKSDLDSQGVKLVNLQESYVELQEENSKMLEENGLLLEKFLSLKEEMCVLEEENRVIFHEAVDLNSLSLVFKSISIEKAEEVKALTEDLNGLHVINCDLMEKVELLGEKLRVNEAEGQHLNETVEKLCKELHEVKDLNVQLNNQISTDQDSLRQKATELLEVEQKLKATHNLNGELWRTVEDLKKECEELKLVKENVEKRVSKMSEDFTKQKSEIECLNEVNRRLETEVGILREEIEEGRFREVYLSSELQERNNEFEIWDAEAAAFYFDLQISSIREVLLENKVQELTGVCESLEGEKASKSVEIVQMKEKVGFLEGEIGQLKAQLSSYVPAIASLRDNIASLEHNVRHHELHCPADKGELILEKAGQLLPMSYQEQKEIKSIEVADGISELQEIQTRIRAVEKVVVEEMERFTTRESSDASIKVENAMTETEDLKRSTPHLEKSLQKEEVELEDDFTDHVRLQKSKQEISEVGNKTSMKDIPLDQASDSSFYGRSKRGNSETNDQMLGLWESAEQDWNPHPTVDGTRKQAAAPMENRVRRHSKDMKLKNPPSELQVEKELGVDKLEVSSSNREPSKEGNTKKILERLASDAQKLTSLQTSVQDLKKKLETSKRSKKTNDPEYERIRGQLRDVEEAVLQLADSNLKLTRDTEESRSSSSSDRKSSPRIEEAGDISRNKVTEEARKGSETIGRLQLEMQSILYVMLKLEDEEDNTTKDKFRFSESKTGSLLRDFIHSGGGGRSSGGRRKKKGCLCGCVRPSTNED